MTALVGCYRGCGNRTAVVHSLGQVDSAIGGVVVVGKVTLGAGYRDIIDAIVAQLFLEFAVKIALHHITEYGDANK